MTELDLEELTENEMTGKDYYGQLIGTQNSKSHIYKLLTILGFFF